MPSAGICVSIVGNDPQTSQLVSDWIRAAEGFCLFSHHTTAETALAALRQEKPAIVLMDIGLPGVSALNCIRQLKPSLQQTQFVPLVAEQNTDHIFNALAAGASGYLPTKTPRAELLAALRHIHAGGSPINVELSKKILHFFQQQSPRPVYAAAEPSPREKRLLRLLASGSSFNEVAASLNIDQPMVSTYIRSIYEKVHLQAVGAILP
jgi:DNA-binding NarL/FixJ family response regulator